MISIKVQIANFLNVSPNAILRCEEWVHIYFVVISGYGGRFVSKKVVKVNVDNMEDIWEQQDKEQEQRAESVEAIASRINDFLPIGHCVEYHTLFSAAVDIFEGTLTVDGAVKRFTSKKPILRK